MLALKTTRGGGRLLKPGAFTVLFEALVAGGGSLLRSELLVKASGLSKPQKCPLGRLQALGGLCWRMQNICASLDSTSGGSESDWSPGGLGLSRLLMALACGGTQNNLSQSCAFFFLSNG